MSEPKTLRRTAWAECVQVFNRLASQSGLEPVRMRPSTSDVEDLYGKFCEALDADGLRELMETRRRWVENGGRWPPRPGARSRSR